MDRVAVIGEMQLTEQPSTRARILMNSIEELVARVQGGDDEAFRLIFDRYARPLIRFIYNMMGQYDIAEELTQETFIRAYRNIGSLREPAKFSTWLFGIAKNVVRESQKHRRELVGIDDPSVSVIRDDSPTPDGQLLDKELERAIAGALEAMSEDRRLVFTLKVLQHRSYEEVAQITNFSMAKVKVALYRARKDVRRRLQPYLR